MKETMVYHRSSKKASQDVAEPKNCFRNDGSFLEMFKKMQENSAASSSDSSRSQSSSNHSPASSSSSLPSVKKELIPNSPPVSDSPKSESNVKSQAPESEGKPTLNNKFPFFGKRRGGRALPTGQVKKVKTETKEEVVEEPKDAWSQYLAEVKKYREAACEEEGKVRPLVK